MLTECLLQYSIRFRKLGLASLLKNVSCQNALYQQIAEVELCSGVSPDMAWDPWSILTFMVSSTPMPTALFDDKCFKLWQFYGLDPKKKNLRRQASCHVSTLTKALWCQWSIINGLILPRAQISTNYREDSGTCCIAEFRVINPKSVKELICLLQAEWKKIPLAVIQRLVESYAPGGFIHAVIAFVDAYQLLILHKVRFSFLSQVSKCYW
ncbi:hypothetical protein CEXT_428121 [Caerostris extrusa]|uniref:Uncharacterized protein n=1 Tax=Caerostris extrusa TaxID=172846 RepID=A0AAV4MPC4_CAEEX|nr:hypothetical protein CEXT_428121 [Caerostris extrusa]